MAIIDTSIHIGIYSCGQNLSSAAHSLYLCDHTFRVSIIYQIYYCFANTPEVSVFALKKVST